jgi:hypothetical protein
MVSEVLETVDQSATHQATTNLNELPRVRNLSLEPSCKKTKIFGNQSFTIGGATIYSAI